MAAIQVAIIGCGAVAAVHARLLRAAGIVIASACDLSLEIAQRFADAHGIERAVSSIEAALRGVDAAIVASPSSLHYEHALRVLEAGAHVLLELPPCATPSEMEGLAALAVDRRRVVQCAHTSRYLEPYRRIGEWVRANRLGELRQVHYLRCVVPSRRTWADDALLHHAAHPIDLFLDWFGDIRPVAATGQPEGGPYRDIALAACLPNGGPLTIAVSYSSKLPRLRMTLIGSECTILADGFHAIESDGIDMAWSGDTAAVFEQAVSDQDLAFLHCCEAGAGGVPWRESIRTAHCVADFQKLCNR